MTKKQKRMRQAVDRMKHYLDTYDQQPGFLDYSDDTFIRDMLYGIGVALDQRKYAFAHGFDEFKTLLSKYVAP